MNILASLIGFLSIDFYYSASAYLATRSTVLAMIDSVRLSVRHSLVSCQTTQATIMESSLQDNPMTLVS